MDGPNVFATWTGGKPKYDWSELEIKDPNNIPIAAVRPTYACSSPAHLCFVQAEMELPLH